VIEYAEQRVMRDGATQGGCRVGEQVRVCDMQNPDRIR
jgi:hypothetical protein